MIRQRLNSTLVHKERALLAVIRDLFGDEPFDMPAITFMTFRHPELVAAIEATLPGRQWWRADHKDVLTQTYGTLLRLLRRLAKQHFIIDVANPNRNEWRLPEEQP
jgi:hypothetical protein